MSFQLLYLVPGAILYSKLKYSDVTLMKPPFINHFNFPFLSRKPSKMENIQ